MDFISATTAGFFFLNFCFRIHFCAVCSTWTGFSVDAIGHSLKACDDVVLQHNVCRLVYLMFHTDMFRNLFRIVFQIACLFVCFLMLL